MHYCWVKSVPASQVPEWEDYLFECEQTNLVMQSQPGRQSRIQGYFTSRRKAEDMVSQFGGKVSQVKDQNWAALGSPTSRRFIRIRDRFIVTLDEDAKFLSQLRKENPERDLLRFPPGLAFGTGDHATTASCLRLIVDLGRSHLGQDWSHLDLGTGTGILAIAGRFLGAKTIRALEFDPKAIRVAQASIQRHRIPPSDIDLQLKDVLKWKPGRQRYDLVTANLFSTVLVEAMPLISRVTNADGRIILSGILHSQSGEVEEAVNSAKLTVQRSVKLGRWVTLLVSK